jgi:hypothetical protein
MEDTAAGFEAIAETTSFLHYFNDLPDYRQPDKVEYPLPEVLLLILLAVLADADPRCQVSGVTIVRFLAQPPFMETSSFDYLTISTDQAAAERDPETMMKWPAP